MNKKAKIHLSALELELVNNTQWIFTKQIIIKKVQHLLGDLHDYYRKVVEEEKDILPGIFQRPGGKITKGENYQGLPYLILDYPAYFGKENIFAVRTMFWWGNFFSISLHVSGKYFSCRENMWQLLDALKEKNFWVCVNEDEWEHHFQPHNYCVIHEMTEYQISNLGKKDFLKFGKKIELTTWDLIPFFLEHSFKEIIELIKVNFPTDGKVP